MKQLVKWAVIVVLGFLALRWVLNMFATPAPPNIADGSIYPGWGYAGPIYARPPRVWPWAGPHNYRRDPRPWRGESYAGKG